MENLNEKIVLRVGRLQFTTLALSEAVAALVLGVLSLLFLVSGYRDWQVTTHFGSALQAFFSDQASEAGLALERARSARPEYVPVQEIYAKMLIDRASPYTKDVSSLNDAIDVLTRAGGGQPPWTVQVAGAVARIKKFDLTLEKSHLDEAEKLLEAARSSAPQIPEPVIELGQIALRRGDRTTAERLFKEAEEEPFGIPTLDGLLDLYLGRAGVYILAKRWSDARDEFLRAHSLSPRAKLPGIAYTYLCARIAADPRTLTEDELAALEVDLAARLGRVVSGMGWPEDLSRELERAQYSSRVSVMSHWARMGNHSAITNMFSSSTPPVDRSLLLLNGAFGLLNSAARNAPKPSDGGTLGFALDYLLTEVQRVKVPDKLRVTVLNDHAYANFCAQRYELAESQIREAISEQLRLKEPPDYKLQRNLGVLLHVRKQYPEAVKAYEESLKDNGAQPDVRAAVERLKRG